MRHDWIFDVLTDLRSYAERHNLLALAAQVEEAMRIARAEVEFDSARPVAAAEEASAPEKTLPEDRRH